MPYSGRVRSDSFSWPCRTDSYTTLDELQEFCENQESEQVSLVGSTRSRRSATRRLPSPSLLQVAREWFNGIVSKNRDRSAYEPIRGDE